MIFNKSIVLVDFATWGYESNNIDFKPIWDDSQLDNNADAMINFNTNVSSGWLGDVIKSTSDL